MYESTETTSIETYISKQHLRWIGHTIRMPSDRLPRQTLYGQLQNGIRAPGGQKKRYKDHTKITLKKCGINPNSLEQEANDRAGWRNACRVGLSKLETDLSNQRDKRRTKRHQRRAEVAQEAPFQCQACERSFTSRIGLNSHTRWHQRQNH